jgi:hydroxymethylglutaryl-CoA synthase
MSTTSVGIDALGVYLPRYTLPLAALAEARGVPPEKIAVGLGCLQMAVTPPWEDTVTLGANAASRLFAEGLASPDEIGLLVVGTETAVDHAKPVGIFLHGLLGLPNACRVFELKHACYGGTAGVMLATDWVRSGAARGRKALVVASDIARYDLHSSAEFTQGAGAAAMLVGAEPRLLALDPRTGVYANDVYDFWRPLDRREALVDGKFSIDCYLDALAGALADWRAHHEDAQPLLERFAALLYHTPFPKMALKAHQRLVERVRPDLAGDDLTALFKATYDAKVEPWLALARQAGNSYTASLWLCLAWLAERRAAELAGREVSLFSYGSGSCAEFFTGTFVPGADRIAAKIGAQAALDARTELTVAQYEELMAKSATGGEPADGYRTRVHLARVADHKRQYLVGTHAA